MQKTILVLALLCFSGFAFSQFDDLTTLWSTWKINHARSYTPGEDAARYAIFVENYNKVIKFNAEHTSVKLGMNKFADLTASEFKHKHSNCAFFEDDEELVKAHTVSFKGAQIPASVDWRTQGAVTPVKNQGQCGSCWTFSTTGVLEGYYFLKDGTLDSFSEQQIVDCATSAGEGCSGGWPYLAVQYAAGAGLELESEYPYTAADGNCDYVQTEAVTTNDGYSFVTNYNSDDLKAAIATMPVSVLIEADQDVFQLYTSGVIGANDGCGDSLDHAVLAVGYGSYAGQDAFFIKNSWGADWGVNGYVYLSTDGSANAGAGVCGVLSQPLIPN